MKRNHILPTLLVLAAGWSVPAKATEGDIFAKGTEYNVSTYDATNLLTKKNHPSYYGHHYTMPVDINIGSGDDDENTILYAPEDGTVIQTHYNEDCWGYAIEWINNYGSEKIFFAHLNEVIKTGRIYGGEKIGRLGGTGGPNCAWSPHLHIESSTGWLELSGKEIHPPINPAGNGDRVVSAGPIKKFFCVSEPATHPFEKEYDIAWWPSDVPCVEAREWMENERCVYNVYALSYDKTICKKAFSTLSRRSWIWDGTYDGWYKIFFEKFDLSYLQCK